MKLHYLDNCPCGVDHREGASESFGDGTVTVGEIDKLGFEAVFDRGPTCEGTSASDDKAKARR